ncbi:RNA-processing protein [Candidatus Woesearchaeota archaeon CG_4_10_14_0_2_um_filter_57_5]|nr:MAG: RNA-processing protein [Candidatus Woesearchaeota archaeon CG11_big_fil_rev_8_21_14_0_20_57_5]PIZ53975.1 MAG: RNA-processing protein [Candidatus Woesearchaeota archaeon CG_4_10_14_0_2_um_filter_57_5]
MTFSFSMKIPKERVAVLIGTKGESKRAIEARGKCHLRIDSEEGDVEMTGEDAILLYTTQEVIKSVARGFNPDIAMNLYKIDYAFDLLNLSDVAKTQSGMQRLKGRVIGHEGKARKVIEELTDCNVSVYGKTISIIGPAERISIARRSIEMILGGSRHGNVYRFLEGQRRKWKRDEMGIGV